MRTNVVTPVTLLLILMTAHSPVGTRRPVTNKRYSLKKDAFRSRTMMMRKIKVMSGIWYSE